MTKFKEFSNYLISSGAIGEPSLVHLRRILRQAGLISSGGQGFASKPLEIFDITNVFLALVAADQAKNSPAVVRLYRSATVQISHSENCDPWPFTISHDACLGEFLDCFFEGMLHGSSHEYQLWTNLRFKFLVTDGYSGVNAKLWFDDGNMGHVAVFSAFNADALKRLEVGDSDFMFERAARVSREASVGDDFLRPLLEFVIENLFADEVEDQSDV